MERQQRSFLAFRARSTCCSHIAQAVLSVNASICADSGGIKIYVLDNDEDEDGDQLEITDVGNPSNGTAVAIDDDGDGVKDAISYTPSNSPDTVTFEYTISDGNGGTDTAEVTVNVTGDESSCGPLTVRVEDPDGNLVPGVGGEEAPTPSRLRLPSHKLWRMRRSPYVFHSGGH